MEALTDGIASVLDSSLLRDHGMLVFAVALAVLYFMFIPSEGGRGPAPGGAAGAHTQANAAGQRKGDPPRAKALTRRAMAIEARLRRPSSVAIGLTGTVLEQVGPGRFRTTHPDVAELLADIASFTNLYLVLRLGDEADADAAMAALRDAAVVPQQRIPEHRVLFATTEKGHCAVVRQLTPTCYIDADADALRYMAPHTRTAVFIGEGATEVADLPAEHLATLFDLCPPDDA